MTPSGILNICFDLNEKTLQIDFSQTDTETQNKILEELFGKELLQEKLKGHVLKILELTSDILFQSQPSTKRERQ
ncbi:hypothetical protein KVD04_06640 [Helicobacter pylori]|nr:hypothetical protein KVD04_04620 [Helicobacter pylori]WQS57097.1 hypothetical protein KVD04_06640 [Helicobacter pylori]